MKMLDCFKAFAIAIAIATAGDVCANENTLLIGHPLITSFKFSNQSIGWKGDGYWEGVINYKNKTITFTTQRWIENIDKLPAIFELDGDGVAKVGGKLQFSGATINDFRKDVVYTVGDVEYTVKFASPQASGLPVIRIDTKDGAPILDRENYVNMTFALTDPNNPKNDVVVENTVDGIRGRGNTTWLFSKRPYRIKFDKKQSLFGLPAAKSWVLLSEFLDPTLIKNTIAFELGDRFGLQYNHSYHHVVLYLNGDYRGHYMLTEQNQVGKGRVDIDEDNGWLVEFDFHFDEEPKFRSKHYSLPVMIKSPVSEPMNISNPAYSFVIENINELCDSLASVNFPENEYRNLIDMDNFIQYLTASALIGWSDFNIPGSVYLYKEKDGKISMGPLWDYNSAIGFSWDHTPLYYLARIGGVGTPIPSHAFFNRFFQDPVFLVKCKEFWNKKYHEISSTLQFIDEIANNIKKSAEENFKKWWIDYPVDFDEQINIIKGYYSTRVTHFDGEYNKVEVLPKNKTFTTQVFGYTEIAPQTFTLVSYGDMKNLSATFKKEELSGFEVSTKLSKTTTGNGGYLATISVKPKNSLSVETYTDTLVLSGVNQAQRFSIEVPLAFAVNEAAQPAPDIASIYKGGNAATNQAVQTHNGINLATANNATLEIFNLRGSLISRRNFSSGVHAIRLEHLPKGIYIAKVSFGSEKQILRVPVR